MPAGDGHDGLDDGHEETGGLFDFEIDAAGSAPAAVPDPLDRLWRHPSELPAPATVTTLRPSKRSRRGAALLIAAAIGGIAVFAAFAVTGRLDDDSSTEEAASGGRGATPLVAEAVSANTPAAAARSVVEVRIATTDGVRTGTGVCTGRHEVVTDADLVGDATGATLIDFDGHSRHARVVGRDVDSGLAVLALDGAGATPAPIATTEARDGDLVFAIVAERGARVSIVRGLLDSTDVRVATEDGRAATGLLGVNLPSKRFVGAALVDEQGRLLGVVTPPVSGSDVRYVATAGEARRVAADLIGDGVVEHGWIGARVVDGDHGPVVFEVREGTPAARAGIAPGDVLVAVDGEAVDSAVDVRAEVRSRRRGDRAKVTVHRGGADWPMVVEVGAQVGTQEPAGKKSTAGS